MELSRGHIVLATGPDETIGKLRLFVVVQSGLFNDVHPSTTVCPLTSVVGGEHLFRVPLIPSDQTGLNRECEVQVDMVQSLRRHRLTRVIGTVPVTTMTQIDDALRRWLQL